ncbi:phenylacetate--CoA ligase family protein [Curvivirga aplysinae]|uniref:phenylacetate--CoA ligase family protein n=1 Tax=Curvivirga aplysinae TaxID=2529852 RepID=UPI0012BC7819|nr:AMP-binding protein [Curvivirga aplysinae]MTI09502.1 phenylacetate--CoA ligase family protein [Curvivirga aplysinae]
MTEFFDALETRDEAKREADQLTLLKKQLAHAKVNSAHYAKALADIDVDNFNSLSDLASLPLTRKSDLLQAQQDNPPFGGLNATAPSDLLRVFMSPGPIADPEGHADDWWRMGRAAYAAGLRKGDIVLNCFSYHHTPAGHMFETAAKAVGCAVYPGGVGQTDAQVAAIQHFGISAYVGTPDFLKVILDKAVELGADVSSLKKALVSGGPLFPSMREEYESRGIEVVQCFGTADLGLVSYETSAKEGMVVDENVILEIVRPGTGEPVADGEVGEIIVTMLTNTDYPLIRFGTGDMSAVLEGHCPTGRTNTRIKGWMGRADQRTKVKGMFVDPAQVDRVVKAHDDVTKMRLEITLVDNADVMTVKVETSAESDDLKATLENAIRTEIKLRGVIEFVEVGGLPNDGKVIDDQRSYD